MLRSPPKPMWDLTIQPFSVPSEDAGTCSSFQLMWDLIFAYKYYFLLCVSLHCLKPHFEHKDKNEMVMKRSLSNVR